MNIPLNRCHYWLHLLCKQGLLEDSGEGYAPSTIAREAILNVQRQDYYQGVAALNPGSENLSMSGLLRSQQHTLRQLVEELKTPGLEQSRHDEILDIILANIRQNRGTLYK